MLGKGVIGLSTFMISKLRRAAGRIPFRSAWRVRSVHLWFWPSLLIVLGTMILMTARILPLRKSQETFVLHYSTALGIDRVGPWFLTFAPAAAGLIILVVNLFLVMIFIRRDRLLASMVGATTVVLEFGFLAAGILIILLNV